MSKQKLNNLAKKLDEIFKEEIREEYGANTKESYVGQIFILEVELVSNLIKTIFQKAEIPEDKIDSETRKIMTFLRTKLRAENSSSKVPRKSKNYATKLRQNKIPGITIRSTDEVYAVRSYSRVSTFKNDVGKKISKVTAQLGNIEQSSSEFTGFGNKTGLQLGHGDKSAAVSLIKVLKVESVLQKYGSNKVSKEIQHIKKSYAEKHNLNISLTHDHVFTSTGSFKKNYVAIFNSQLTEENQKDKVFEQAFFAEVKSYVTKSLVNDLADLESSKSLNQAIASVTLGTLKDVKGAKITKTTRNVSPSKKVRSKTTTKRKSKAKVNTPNIIGGTLVSSKEKAAANKSVGSSPLALIQLFNARLPDKVAKNMHTPRLNFRTGRFASSVKVVDAAQTAQGFLSFGYTYMKRPYQTFEPGYAQGSVDRDPRKLIDRSMREIAAEFAIGRFYTRRL
jgi:nitrogen regulatory protein PII